MEGLDVSTATAAPPHNPDAEAALLGAALLTPRALEALNLVDPEDFYVPAHIRVAAAIRAIQERDSHVDPVTVADQLRRAGQYQDGDAALLVSLQAGTPSTTNAAGYAEIVVRDALARRIGGIAGELYKASTNGQGFAPLVQQLTDIVARHATGALVAPSSLERADFAALLRGDLVQEEPFWYQRSDGRALVYAGRMHIFHGEPSSGKSWVALAVAVAVLTAGGTVVYLDWEDTKAAILARLLALGADPADIVDRCHYYNPTGPIGPAERAELDQLVADQRPDLVVCDGLAEALTRDGLNEDRNSEVITWIEKVARPMARAGAAVIILDHVAKSKEERGRWQRGAGAKLGAVDGASYEVLVGKAYNRETPGSIRLIVAKDRPGAVGVIGECVAVINVVPHQHGARLELTPMAPADVAGGGAWQPTDIMSKVARLLAEAPEEGLSQNAIETSISGHAAKYIRQAIDALVGGGWVEQRKGSNRRKMHRLVRPYDPEDDLRARDDPGF